MISLMLERNTLADVSLESGKKPIHVEQLQACSSCLTFLT